jgi:hypothetical protein
MKGYVYLDLDMILVHKNWDYINNDNPGFFSQNRNYIVKSWVFDTEDKRSFLNMLEDFNRIKIPPDRIGAFLASINHLKAPKPIAEMASFSISSKPSNED